MISAEPLEHPLPNDPYYPRAIAMMRRFNVHLLCVEKCWSVLREYPESAWFSVLDDLRMQIGSTSKWFT